jgi:nucleoside-diphosphate-sugar epimerase
MASFSPSSSSKPHVLVLGGVGFVGRNFVKFLLDQNIAASIKVADKTIPQIAFMNAESEALFEDEERGVKYIQADLSKDAHLDKVFSGDPIDLVFNLAAETRYGQPAAVYTDRCTTLSKKCAIKAKEHGVKRFVEVSTALVYKPQGKKPAKEEAALEPWTEQATAKLNAENEVLAVEGLDVVILRPAFIYGPGDVNGLMPRVVCAASYVESKETMKFLWDARMRINTVHVDDVCRALLHVTDPAIPSGSIFNLCDKNDSDQAKINALVGELFGIKTGFLGVIISNLARLRFTDVVDAANEKHMTPWDAICRKHGITMTPLSPYMSKELLLNNHLYVDGTKIETTGFTYKEPLCNISLVRESVQAAVDIKIFPPVLVEPKA